VVITHPRRRALADALRDRHPELGLRVVADPEPDGPPWVLRTAREGWRAVGPDASHHLVLQDDVLLCDDFLTHLHEAVRVLPHAALSLFADWSARNCATARLAALTGAHWAPVVDTFAGTQAMVVPRATALAMAEFFTTEALPGEPDDVAALRFFRATSTPCLVSVPNLVEHLDVPSVVGNEYLGVRRSVCFIPRLPVGHRWTAEVLDVPDAPYLQWRTGTAHLVRPGPAGQRWMMESPEPYLAARGLSGNGLRRDASGSAATAAGFARLRGRLPEDPLRELYVAGVLLGLAAAAAAATGRPVDLCSPVAAAALDSLPPGTLRRFADLSTVEGLLPDLRALVYAGVRVGVSR
jgi:hypothetical protein